MESFGGLLAGIQVSAAHPIVASQAVVQNELLEEELVVTLREQLVRPLARHAASLPLNTSSLLPKRSSVTMRK
jgi:hypothetical protein